jgi:hypothetical protein
MDFHTHLNVIAGELSRLKDDNDRDLYYEKLKETYPMLIPCRQFQPLTTLLTMMWDFLLDKSCPNRLILKELKPSTLGQFTFEVHK